MSECDLLLIVLAGLQTELVVSTLKKKETFLSFRAPTSSCSWVGVVNTAASDDCAY